MISISLSGIDGVAVALDAKVTEAEAKLAKGIAVGGQIVRDEAKAVCPVDTGELRRSISSSAQGLTSTIGTNKEYAMYVEFGTCKMAAQPYLVPSLTGSKDEILEAIKREFK